MPLPSRTIDAIFARMLVRYGAAWLRMWADIPMEAVKADWANELDKMSPAHVRYALDHLPADYPPTVAQFRALALNMPEYHRALPAPKSTPSRVAAELARMRSFQAQREPLGWAKALEEREKAGEPVTEAVRAMWRSAVHDAPSNEPIVFNTIAPELLPPGMRDERA